MSNFTVFFVGADACKVRAFPHQPIRSPSTYRQCGGHALEAALAGAGSVDAAVIGYTWSYDSETRRSVTPKGKTLGRIHCTT
jgi:hypothetical protein